METRYDAGMRPLPAESLADSAKDPVYVLQYSIYAAEALLVVDWRVPRALRFSKCTPHAASRVLSRTSLHAQSHSHRYRCPEAVRQNVFNRRGCPRKAATFAWAAILSVTVDFVTPLRRQPPAIGLPDLLDQVRMDHSDVQLPFDVTQVVDNLTCERYLTNAQGTSSGGSPNPLLSKLYYSVRPLLPTSLRIPLQRMYFRGSEKIAFPAWPLESDRGRFA